MHNATQSHVRWVRAFFNSAKMTEPQHSTFDQRCADSPRCMTEDMGLRGYTPYESASELKWKEPPKNKGIRTLAGVVAACCSSFGVFAFTNVFSRRTLWQKLWPNKARVTETTDIQSMNSDDSKKSKAVSASNVSTVPAGAQTPLPAYGAQTPRSGSHRPAPSYHTAAPSLHRVGSLASLSPNDAASDGVNSARDGNIKLEKALHRISEMSNFEKVDVEGLKSVKTLEGTVENADEISPVDETTRILLKDPCSLPASAFVMTEGGKQAVDTAKTVNETKEATQVTVAPTRPFFNHTWSFNTFENSIHPDHATGKPIMTLKPVYPGYEEPTLAILLFSVGLQIIVELSTWVQAFLSLKLFVFLNPMTFCIYLTHGFVMWTWGAWVSLACNAAHMPY